MVEFGDLRYPVFSRATAMFSSLPAKMSYVFDGYLPRNF